MPVFSHFLSRLSILALIASIGGAVMLPASSSIAAAGKARSPSAQYLGRWTVDEVKPVFSSRGRLYKSIDIVTCGKSLCGVSVGEGGQCGVPLFRSNHDSDRIIGKGKWGTTQKNVVIYAYNKEDSTQSPGLDFYLGDGYDLGGRSENMHKFHTTYRRSGGAKCKAV